MRKYWNNKLFVYLGILVDFSGPRAQKKLLGCDLLWRSVPKLTLWVNEKQKLWKEWKQKSTSKEKHLEAKKIVCHAKCKKQKGKNLETQCSGMIRNAMFLRLQRGWSKLIRILLVSKTIIDEERKKLGNVVMRSFWAQSLYGTGIVCPRQIRLPGYLSQ